MGKKLSKSQLQSALNSLAAANSRALVARNKIMAHCEAVYGVVPGDIDNDAFIDNVDGGGGNPQGMSVDAFEQSMRDCMEREGIDMPSRT